MAAIAAWTTAHPLVRSIGHGTLTGVLSAMAIDYHAFRSWKSWHDAASYQWSLACWRWVQGAVVGAVTGAGLALA